MLAWVVICRRHLGQSRKPHLPRALGAKGAIRPFRISLPRSSFNISTCKPSNIPTFGFPYLLPSSVSRNPFVCHSYENCRGVYQQFPFWFTASQAEGNSSLATRNSIRWEYPVGRLMNRVYLDFNATTPVEPEVLDAMLPYFSAEFANAASIHTPGQRARAAVESAREQVSALIGARPQEIVFTSGGTESDNHAILGIVSSSFTSFTSSTSLTSHPHIITTAIEHEAVLNACQALEKEGVRVTYLPTDRDGQIDLDELRRAIRPETILITVMHANNELGTIQPLEEIGRIAAEADVYFHTDAVQSAGKVPIDVNALQVDLLSLSGHKLYAPKGIGALYVRGGTRLRQLLYGGHHQRGFRPGTENVPGIVGLGKAAELARL